MGENEPKRSTVDVIREQAQRLEAESKAETDSMPEEPAHHDTRPPEEGPVEEPIKVEKAEKVETQPKERKPRAKKEPAAVDLDKPKVEAKKPVAAEPEDDEPVILPGRLSAEKKEVISKLPKEAQRVFAAELRAMESGTSKVAQELTTYKKFYQGLDEVVRPHVGELQRAGLTPVNLVKGALELHQDLQQNPVDTLLALAQQNNAIDGLKARLSGTAPAAQPSNGRSDYRDPRVDELQQKLDGVLGHVQTERSRIQQDAANRAVSEWRAQKDEYGIDAHPYLQELMPEIGPIVQQMEQANIELATQDPAAILEFAYSQALKAHPELRGAITRKREAAAKQQQIATEKERAAKARSGAVSIKGDTGTSVPTVNFKDTRAILEALSAGELKPI